MEDRTLEQPQKGTPSPQMPPWTSVFTSKEIAGLSWGEPNEFPNLSTFFQDIEILTSQILPISTIITPGLQASVIQNTDFCLHKAPRIILCPPS
jgi:hypothetical protein